MNRTKPDKDLSIEELRWRLVEKRRAARHERLEKFRRTGRVIRLAPDVDNDLSSMHSGTLLEGTEPVEPVVSRRSTWRRILDSLLLVVELAAVVGVLFVLFTGMSMLRKLNQEAASAMVQPTLTPTPLIVAVVLPSGHTPPNAAGGARPNEAEIPEHLRPLVQSLASIPAPTPGPEQAIRLKLPAIKVDAPIVQGDGWEQLKKGVGQHLGTSNPGKQGNMVLSAHNDIFGEIFRDLDQLKPGDEVVVFTNQRPYTYIVIDTQVVEPIAVEVMEATEYPSVTLISCYPYLVDDQRIVVTARLQAGR